MQLVRPPFASHPRRFGRGPARVLVVASPQRMTIPDDLKLFVATFFAGFLFVSIVIG